MNRLCILSILLVVFFNLESHAQHPTLHFQHITSSQGLSQNHGLCIVKDYKGFMWFGTEDGLNKYDGYKMAVYKNNQKDPGSLSNNYILNMYEDKDKNLWVATMDGLNLFDRENDKFIRFKNDVNNTKTISHNNIKEILEDRNGNLWFGTGTGLNLFDKKTKSFTCYSVMDQNHKYVTALFEDKSGNFWVGTTGGLHLFDRKKKTFKSYPNKRVGSIIEDTNGNLWVGTWGTGLCLFERDKEIFTTCYTKDLRDDHSISNNVIYTMRMDSKRNFWVGTENGGLDLFLPETGKFTRYAHDVNDKYSLSNNSVSAIYEDENETLWVGVHRGGINYFNPNQSKFKLYQQEFTRNSLSNDNVKAFFEDKKGGVWIGTDGGGLNLYDRKKNEFTNYRHDANNPNSISSDVVLSIFEDHDENLWIGTYAGGLNMFDRKNNRFIHYRHNPSDSTSLGYDDAWCIAEDSKSNLWIGTRGSGLNLLNRKTNRFIRYKFEEEDVEGENNIIICIYQDTKENLWIGTYGGLVLFDPKTNNHVRYKHNENNPTSISSDEISVVFEDHKSNLWIGTRNGLNVLDPKTKSFKIYKQEDGLPNNIIQGITEDEGGNLWVSTLMGLSKFNPESGKFRNYTEVDGLPGNEFSQNAYLKTKNGEMFFGGISGFSSFYPDNVKDNKHIPPVWITGFEIFNKPVQIDEKDSPLNKAISETKILTLSYKQSVFTFEFSALNYILSEKNKYAYKLEGFDRQWNYVGNKRTVTYTNLNPGEYIFQVMGSNNDGIWNEKITSVRLIITPPFWLTWWFKTFGVFFIVGSFIVFYRLRMGVIHRQQRELERQVKERTEQLERSTEAAEEASRAKSVFLATMSHEIRTPMNGVIGMAALLAETPLTSEQQEYAKTIQNSGESLLSVINDILDYSKIESGKMELENKGFDLRLCVEEVLDLFAGKATEAGLDLIYQIDSDVPNQIIGDSFRLRQILMNLVGNAIKFTHHGEIFIGIHLLSARKDKHKVQLRFEVRDTGIGIPTDKLDRLFKAFSQVDSSMNRKYGGSGLGLVICEKLVALMDGRISVESSPGQGTTFTFIIKTNISQQSVSTSVQDTLAGLEGKKILVVDDNSTNRSIFKNQLEQWSLAPTLASSGKQALAILSNSPDFDLVLTDMQMPEMDGVQLAQTIRQQHPGLPIILLSSVGDDRCKSHPQLFSSVLTKPVKQALLCKHILTQLRKQHKPFIEEAQIRKKLHIDFSHKHPMRILIAEDNTVNMKLAERIMTKLGYRPSTAVNGLEVLAALQQKRYDMILMDIQMPEMDGLEATKRIRLQDTNQPVIIAMTANAMQGDRELCLEAGMDDYISKPIKLEDLVAVLEKWALKIGEVLVNKE